jgi:histidinol-phosphate aminotransferase
VSQNPKEWPSWLPLRDELKPMAPYGAPQLDVPTRLNTNENPFGPSAALADQIGREVRAIAENLNRYPDRDALALRGDLAAYLSEVAKINLSANQVWAANGSNEILQQILLACGGPAHLALGFLPSYSMHELIARTTGTRWLSGNREADFSISVESAVKTILGERPHVVFVTSPNNPTGTAVDLPTISAIADAARGVGALVVVDEAYAEFARDPSETALSLLEEHSNVVVTRTMSKAFSLAGARVGYLAADPVVIDALMLVRLPYHLSSITQAVARAALAHSETLLSGVEEIRRQRDRIVSALKELGLDVIPSDANFVLFGRFRDQSSVWSALLDHGVLVRDVGLPGLLRVTAGSQEETDRFITALKQVVSDARLVLGTSPGQGSAE